MCSGCASPGNSMESMLSMQNQISSGDNEKPSTFPTPRIIPRSIYADNCLEFIRACKDLKRSTPRRSETKEIAERAVRRVKESTSPVLVQSGLQESWWAEAMECYCYLRNLQDLPPDGQTPYERRFNSPFDEPVIPFEAEAQFYRVPAKDQGRVHQFGTEVLPGIFMRIRHVRDEGNVGLVISRPRTRRIPKQCHQIKFKYKDSN